MEKFRVLLVDDEEDFVRTLSERLQMRDLDSQTAFDGEEALELMEDGIPDVMVLDLKMPGIDGMEVLRRMKKLYPGVQVIILTGHGSDKDEAEARRLGAFEYLQKPVNLEYLMAVLKRAYQKKVEASSIDATFDDAG
ncbi:MAG: response regulator [Deltaproteobacteria bacterium]|nr:response regulator [Deltaproteobacteria bacterium]